MNGGGGEGVVVMLWWSGEFGWTEWDWSVSGASGDRGVLGLGWGR
jgi:hypothetical protein